MALFCCPLWRLDLQKIEMTQPRTLNSYCMTEASSHCWRELNLIWWPRGLKLQNQCLPLVLGIPWTVITRVYPWFAGEKIKKGHEDKLPAVVCEGPFFLFCFLIMRKITLKRRKDWSLLTLKKIIKFVLLSTIFLSVDIWNWWVYKRHENCAQLLVCALSHQNEGIADVPFPEPF